MTAPSAASSTRTADRPLVARPPWLVALFAVTSLAALVVPALVTTVLAGTEPYDLVFVTYPGMAVAVATAVGQAIATGASTVAVGALGSMLFFRVARGREANELRGVVELPILQAASAVWATASGAMVFLDMLDSTGTSFERITEPGAVAFLYGASSYPAAWTVSFV
ncbi:MAG: cytochrome c oxidase assembly protein, partial [Pseudoclavibacter sp.]